MKLLLLLLFSFLILDPKALAANNSFVCEVQNTPDNSEKKFFHLPPNTRVSIVFAMDISRTPTFLLERRELKDYLSTMDLTKKLILNRKLLQGHFYEVSREDWDDVEIKIHHGFFPKGKPFIVNSESWRFSPFRESPNLKLDEVKCFQVY